jgi:hypothetical protein
MWRWWFVLVVGCSQPAAPPPSRPPPVEDPPDERPTRSGTVESARFSWQKERDQYVPFDGSRGPCRTPHPDNPHDCPRRPSRIAGKVVQYVLRDGALVIRIDRGRRDSVDRGWTATLLDDRDREIAPSSPITSVHDDESFATVSVGPDTVQANRRVLLERGR